MKRVIFAIMLVLVLPLGANSNDDKNRPTAISGDTIHKMIDDGAEFTLIDARREKDYWEEHIVGAISIPTTEVNAKTISEVVSDPDEKIIFYCQNVKCQASEIAAVKTIAAGYKYVYEYNGGIEDWKEHGYPTKKLEVSPKE